MNHKLLQPTSSNNPLVFLDITIGKEFAGRMVIELRKDVVPKTAENFRALCTGEYGIGKMGKPLHYKGIRFHKVTRVFVAQSGDIVNNDGTSGESIYGPVFEDENFALPHEDGVVSMANYGEPNSNNSQFAITSGACDNLDGTNVVVGKILRGMGIIGEMEQNTSDSGQPTVDIVISDCGEIDPGQDWGINECDENTNSLPPYPDDWSRKYEPINSNELISILTEIRQCGNKFFAKQRYYEARRKYRKANRYYNMLRSRHEWQEFRHVAYNNEDLKKLDAFSVLNNINMAAVELKLQQYENAKYACSEAIRLDGNCSKAYYRRGQASLSLKNYEDAIDDLQHALELMPENKQILNELNRAKKLLFDYNRLQMNALKHLFN